MSRSACPACGSLDVQTRFDCRFDERPIAPYIESFYKIDPAQLPGRYQAQQCNRCSSYFQGEVGDSTLLAKLYSDWVFDIGDPMRDAGYAFDVTHPWLSRHGHEIITIAAVLRLTLNEVKTLDFGMGWASWARVAASLGCQSYGDELEPTRGRYAAEHGVRPHGAANTYHFINTEQVFEHLTEPFEAARALAGSLEPGGILKISVPSPKGLNRLFASLRPGEGAVTYEQIMPLHPLEHVNCFSRTGLRALANRLNCRLTRPGLWNGYKFVLHSGTLDFRLPARAAKELVRPIHQLVNSRNHYVWLRKPRH